MILLPLVFNYSTFPPADNTNDMRFCGSALKVMFTELLHFYITTEKRERKEKIYSTLDFRITHYSFFHYAFNIILSFIAGNMENLILH